MTAKCFAGINIMNEASGFNKYLQLLSFHLVFVVVYASLLAIHYEDRMESLCCLNQNRTCFV